MAADNHWRTQAQTFESPSRRHAELTPSDANELSFTVRRIYVGGTGDIELVDVLGNSATYVGVPAGTWVGDCVYKQVKATGTTATNLVGLE